MSSTKRELGPWENPPDFRLALGVIVWTVLACSIILLGIGIDMLQRPGDLFWDILPRIIEAPSLGGSNATGTNWPWACRTKTRDFCPTATRDTLTGQSDLAPWFKHLGVFVTLTGLIDVVGCMFSNLALVLHDKKLLFLIMFMIPISMTMKYKMIDYAVSVDTPMHEESKDEILRTFHESYKLNHYADDFATIFNMIMMSFECCGVRHPDDVLFKQPYTDSKVGVNYERPVACCVTSSTISAPFVNTVRGGMCYTIKVMEWPINSKGCFAAVFDEFYETYGRKMLVLLIITIIFQSLQHLLTIFVLLRVDPRAWRKAKKAKRDSDGHSVATTATTSDN